MQRAELVAKLREQGWSIRRIAEKLGVSDATAWRDLEGATNVAPDYIIGADGKSYPQRVADLSLREAANLLVEPKSMPKVEMDADGKPYPARRSVGLDGDKEDAPAAAGGRPAVNEASQVIRRPGRPQSPPCRRSVNQRRGGVSSLTHPGDDAIALQWQRADHRARLGPKGAGDFGGLDSVDSQQVLRADGASRHVKGQPGEASDGQVAHAVARRQHVAVEALALCFGLDLA